jgi:hypothetical protein
MKRTLHPIVDDSKVEKMEKQKHFERKVKSLNMSTIQSVTSSSSTATGNSTVPNLSTVKPIQLRDYQMEHFRRTQAILEKFYFYVDGSEMGTGKTIIALAHSITHQLPIIVFCPLAARENWMVNAALYGVQIYNLPETGGVITYDTLRSRKGHQPKHGLLTRDDSGESPNFYATTLFTQIVRAGVLLIFDECQKLKNTSDQYRATKALMRQFYTVGGRSRAAFLSGTAMDKQEHAVNFLRMVGFIEQRNLYSKVRGETRFKGVEDLLTWAQRINPQALDEFMINNKFRATHSGSVEYVFNLFVSVIKPGIMSIMPSLQLQKDIKNGYYILTPDEEQEYRLAIHDLANATRYNPRTDTVITTKENMGTVTKALMRLQQTKIPAMIRVVREKIATPMFDANGNRLTPKFILFADYYEGVIDRLMEELAEFDPVELTGRLPEYRRNENISRFQEPNANCRLLIGNPLVGGLAVNLHDTTGLFPRFMYIMPGYRINELHQATGRIARLGLIGKATIRFFYGLCGVRENNILNALARKGETMQKVHLEQGAKFPNEYENEVEGGANKPVLDDVPETSNLVT